MARDSFQAGSLQLKKRSGKPGMWVLRYRDGAGVRKSDQIGTVEQYPTKAKAERAAFPIRERINDRTACLYFHQLATKYEAEEMPSRADTAAGYRSNLKRLRERFDNERLEDLVKNRVAIESWLKDLKTLPVGKAKTVRSMSPTSKQHIRNLLHLMIKRAMAWGYVQLQTNPISLVRVKGGKNASAPRSVITRQQIMELLRDPKLPVRVKVMIVVAVCTGLRASEILGLRWENLDFEGMAISVENSVVGKHREDPKTEASQAHVPLHPYLATTLRGWKKFLPAINGWVFGNPVTKRPYWRDSIQDDYLKPAGERLGIADLGWHTFRHTYRAAMKGEGMEHETQKDLMRHSIATMTMHYGTDANMELLRPANALLVDKLIEKVEVAALMVEQPEPGL